MVFFITTYINLALLFYIIYSIIIISLIQVLSKFICKNDTNIDKLTSDEYFVLTEKFNIKNIFAYITFKLYNKKALALIPGEIKFSFNNIDTLNLDFLENQIYNYFKANNSTKDFTEKDIDTKYFNEFYNNTYNELYKKHIVKSSKEKIITRLIFNIGLILVTMPGIISIIILLLNNLPITKITIGLIFSCFIYFYILKNNISNNLTPNGYRLFTQYKALYNAAKSSDITNDLSKLLIQNHYMYYFVDDDTSDDDDDEDENDDFDD